MLTATQYDRLPGTARAIVDIDRDLATVRARSAEGNVLHFGSHADMVEQRDMLAELRADRRVLTTRAHETWGKPLRSDGTARA